jgi:hypothetical protein
MLPDNFLLAIDSLSLFRAMMEHTSPATSYHHHCVQRLTTLPNGENSAGDSASDDLNVAESVNLFPTHDFKVHFRTGQVFVLEKKRIYKLDCPI